MNIKQLYEKDGNDYKELFPLINLSDIKDSLDDTNLGLILNMYTHIKVDYDTNVELTRRSVPICLRRSGLYITYYDTKSWITEFYIGANSTVETEDWVNDENWQLVPDIDYVNNKAKPGIGTVTYDTLDDNLKQLIASKIDVTNYPDEEDLTSIDNCIKFKDRESDSNKFQSIGYKIVRKNIVKENDEFINKLTSDSISQHSLNIIQYDFVCEDWITISKDTIILITTGNITFKEGANIDGGKIINISDGLSINSGINVGDLKITPTGFENDAYDYGTARINLFDSIFISGSGERGSSTISLSDVAVLQSNTDISINSGTVVTIKARGDDDNNSVILDLNNGNLKFKISDGKNNNEGNLDYNRAALLGIIDDAAITEVEGKMIYDSNYKMYKMYNGVKWVKLDGTDLPELSTKNKTNTSDNTDNDME